MGRLVLIPVRLVSAMNDFDRAVIDLVLSDRGAGIREAIASEVRRSIRGSVVPAPSCQSEQ